MTDDSQPLYTGDSFINVEQFVTALGGTVYTMDTLQKVLEGILDEELGRLTKIARWRREVKVESLERNLEHQKGTLSLVLNILQW